MCKLKNQNRSGIFTYSLRHIIGHCLLNDYFLLNNKQIHFVTNKTDNSSHLARIE